MQKLVVYTCCFGDYGLLPDPFPDGASGFDRICFTDDASLSSDSWDIVVLEKSGLGPQADSRLPKLLPHRYLKDFDLSIYCDSRVRFKVDPLAFSRAAAPQTSSLKCFSHPRRGCIYDEAEAVIEKRICDERSVREQMDAYRRQGYPEKHGLIAGTVLLRRHNEPRLVDLSELWHQHFLRFCQRDQLAFNFVAWLRGFEYERFDGTLTKNDYITWAKSSDIRVVPNNFNEERFEWLVPEVASSGKSARKYFLEDWDKHKRAARNKRPDLPYFSKLTQLANKYKSDKGTIYYNAHGYARIYEEYLSDLAPKKFNFLEIGLLRHDVQARHTDGKYDDVPSLKMWRDYFDKAAVVGFDIADFSAAAPLPDVRILQGDMGDVDDLNTVLAAADSGYQVIVEDASHASHHQQIALAHLFPHLLADGYYIIEDLHYQPRSMEEKDAVKTVDILRGLESGNLVESKYIGFAALEAISSQIEFIHFYDSLERSSKRIHRDAIAVIKKKSKLAAVSALALRKTKSISKGLFRR